MTNPDAPVHIDRDLGRLRIRLELPAGTVPIASDHEQDRRAGWMTADGMSAVCEALPVAPGQPHAVDAVVGTLIHGYQSRESAAVRNVTRLRVSGADEAIGYALATERGGDAVDHRMVVAASPTDRTDTVAVLQVSWQGIGPDVAAGRAAAFDAIVRSWSLAAPVDHVS